MNIYNYSVSTSQSSLAAAPTTSKSDSLLCGRLLHQLSSYSHNSIIIMHIPRIWIPDL